MRATPGVLPINLSKKEKRVAKLERATEKAQKATAEAKSKAAVSAAKRDAKLKKSYEAKLEKVKNRAKEVEEAKKAKCAKSKKAKAVQAGAKQCAARMTKIIASDEHDADTIRALQEQLIAEKKRSSEAEKEASSARQHENECRAKLQQLATNPNSTVTLSRSGDFRVTTAAAVSKPVEGVQ